MTHVQIAWASAAVVLMVAEIAAPGAFMLWLGFAAAGVFLLLLALPDLAAIWQAVFGIEQIGVHDNFYELGGDSLLATQAVFRLREAFELDLPLRSLFETPTVAGLAEAIELALLAAASPDELAQALDELELSDGRS